MVVTYKESGLECKDLNFGAVFYGRPKVAHISVYLCVLYVYIRCDRNPKCDTHYRSLLGGIDPSIQ